MKPVTALCGGAGPKTVHKCQAADFLDQFQKEGANPALALTYTRMHLLKY